MMKKPFKVVRGAIVVNNGVRIASGPRVEVWSFDLGSKYAEVVGTGGDCSARGKKSAIVMLGATKRTLKLNPKFPPTQMTEIVFPGDWTVVATGMGRYSLEVCLVKPRKRVIAQRSIHAVGPQGSATNPDPNPRRGYRLSW